MLFHSFWLENNKFLTNFLIIKVFLKIFLSTWEKAFLDMFACFQLCKRGTNWAFSLREASGRQSPCPGILLLPPLPQGHTPGSNRHSTVPLSQHYSASPQKTQPFPGLHSLSSLQQHKARNISALFSKSGQKYRRSAPLLHPLWNISSEGGRGLGQSLMADFSLNIEPIKTPV